MANTKKATPRKAAARKTAARKAPATSSHGFKVGDVVHFANVDPREDQRLTVMEVRADDVIGANATGTRMVLNPAKLAKVEE